MCSKFFLVTAFNRGLSLINSFADPSRRSEVLLRVGIDLMQWKYVGSILNPILVTL